MLPILEIIRLEESFIHGTFGVLKINKEFFCCCLEPPDKLNKAFQSSIPAQQYTCLRYDSPKFGETFQIMNVPGRTNVLFHPGNSVKDTAGCPILGQYKAKLMGNRGIMNSGNTFHQFMAVLDGYDKAHLTIKECF